MESHDTYANKGESAGLLNFDLRSGWAIICSRKNGTPLFFSRPKGAEGVQFPGESQIGDAGNDEFKHPEVKAVNLFRKEMIGEDEELFNGADRGAVIVNVGYKPTAVSFPINLQDGQYKDKANKLKFSVKNGVLSGKLPKRKIAVVY